MSKIRVLVVDDAVVVRRMLTELLASDDAIEVVGAAANGRIALSKIAQLQPDLITLDLEMPEMGGLETLAAVRRSHPLLPILVVSRFALAGAPATVDALALGASDYVSMPDRGKGLTEAAQFIREQLIPKIKRYALRKARSTPAGPSPVPRAASRSSMLSLRAPVEVLAIGASTGGPNALAQLLPALPADFPVPTVIVQHMPPVFTERLARRLTSVGMVEAEEAESGAALRPAAPGWRPATSIWRWPATRTAFGCARTRDRPRTRAAPPSMCCCVRPPRFTDRVCWPSC